MTQALFDSESEEEAIERVLAALGQELGWVAGGFWRVGETGQKLELSDSWHQDPREREKYSQQNEAYQFDRGEGLPGVVWETEATKWIGDVSADALFPRRDIAKAYRLRGAIAFPVFVGHDLIGVIEFFSHDEITPEESFVRVLTGIGSELGQYLRRQRAEHRLRDSEARFRTLAETASDSIVTIDAQSVIRYANPATEKLFGYSADELLGMKLTELMPERMRASHAAGLARFSRTGQKNIPWTGVQLPALHRNGREFPVEISFGEFVLDGSRRFTGIMRDVTERVRQQQELEEASAELEASVEELQERTRDAEAASKAKNEFLAAMSHELRTPLQAVIGYAGLLSDRIQGELNGDQARAVERIGASAQHLLGLIDQVLDLARSESGRLKLKSERVDVCRLAAEAGELVRPQAEAKGLQLKIGYCEDEKDRMLVADPGRVRQIVLNLLTNAVKFTTQGQVEVSFERTNGRALVHVSDTGCGIPSDLIPRVFEPFYQTEAGLRNRAAGMGLGLAISRDLAVTMGGGLEVTSEQGKGSRFTLWLPDDS